MNNLRELGLFELLDTRGKPVFFESIWTGRTTVLTLTRHFGCLFCYEQIDALLQVRQQLEHAGAHLVVIGNGNPEHARRFMRHVGLTDDVYTDPARRLYRMLGLVHGVRSTLNWTATKNSRRALEAGFRPDGIQGDRWQQGGTFVAAPNGDLLYSYRSQVAGDHVPVRRVLATVGGSLRKAAE